MEIFLDLLPITGADVSRFIFWISSFLTTDEAPGLISLGIVVWLVVATAAVTYDAFSKFAALKWLKQQVQKAKNEEEFATVVNGISQAGRQVRHKRKHGSITSAWDEFRETLIKDTRASPTVLRNSVRPSSFFNLEDLRYGPGFSRSMPGLFVTVGLFLTFLGLISALQQITGLSDASPEEMRTSLDGLLGAASAKFIMSLTGLLASILFTIVLRLLNKHVESRIHSLCEALEKRLSFISLEEIAMEQLTIARGQKDSFQEIGTTLVAELNKSLQTEIPQSISSSIGSAMAPLLDQVGKAGTDGVGQMVDDLSSRVAEDVGQALTDASTRLSEAGDKIAGLSERMDRSSGQMGQEMEASAGKLTQAAEDLSTRLAGEFSEKIQAHLVEPITRLVNQLDTMADRLKDGSGQIAAAAVHIKSGGEATRSATETLTTASRDLQAATGPIRSSVEQIENSTTALARSTSEAADTVTRSSRETAENAARVLDAAKAALSAEQQLIETSLVKLGEALAQMERQRGQIDDMDEKLGDAFNQFRTNVQTALDALAEHVRKMNGEFAPALDTMREIVDQAERFRPEQGR